MFQLQGIIRICMAVLLIVFGLHTLPCEGRKNVLFLVADDLRPELGAYIGPDFPSPVHPKIHTPNLDGLALKSLVLKRAYVQQAICSPSRTSLLTGRRPDTTHVYDLHHYFRKVGGNFTTIPEYFKLNGYESVGMGKIFHPGHASDHDDPPSWSEPYYHAVDNFEDHNNSWKAVPDELLKDKPLWDEQIATHAIKTLQRLSDRVRAGKTNLFVAVGFHKPHLPFVFPASIMSTYYPADDIKLPPNPYAPVGMPEIAWQHFGGLREYGDLRKLNASGKINTTFPDTTVKELRRAYYSALTWMDLQVGRVLAELERLGLANDTIVSFWGDHGFHLGEHGEWCKRTNFELDTHAPMMLRIPGSTDAGIATRQLTEFVDLFPTLVDAAGLESLPLCPEDSSSIKVCREGTSLVPLITKPDVPLKAAAFSQYPRRDDVMGYTIRTDQYRYTEWAKFTYKPEYKPDWSALCGIELYDHVKDPQENINRFDDKAYRDVRAMLRDALHKGWRGASFTAAQPSVSIG